MSNDPKPAAPAIHTDELWDKDKLTDGLVHNLGPTPVKVETKSEYRRLLKQRGLRMKDQQESDMAPEIVRPELAAPEPEAALPEMEPDLTEGQTRTLFAVGGVWARYGLQEALHCDVCFEAGRNSGCRVTVRGDRTMAIRCNGRTRVHACMVDMSYTASDALTSLDKTEGSLAGPDGRKLLPTTLILADDARLILREVDVLRALKLNNLLYCKGCRQACELQITPEQIVMTCQCQIRFWQGVVH